MRQSYCGHALYVQLIQWIKPSLLLSYSLISADGCYVLGTHQLAIDHGHMQPSSQSVSASLRLRPRVRPVPRTQDCLSLNAIGKHCQTTSTADEMFLTFRVKIKMQNFTTVRS